MPHKDTLDVRLGRRPETGREQRVRRPSDGEGKSLLLRAAICHRDARNLFGWLWRHGELAGVCQRTLQVRLEFKAYLLLDRLARDLCGCFSVGPERDPGLERAGLRGPLGL